MEDNRNQDLNVVRERSKSSVDLCMGRRRLDAKTFNLIHVIDWEYSRRIVFVGGIGLHFALQVMKNGKCICVGTAKTKYYYKQIINRYT